MSRTVLNVYELLFDSVTYQSVRSKIRLHAGHVTSLAELANEPTYGLLAETYGPRMSFDAFFRFNGYLTVDEVANGVRQPVPEVKLALDVLIRDKHVEVFYLGGVQRYGAMSDGRKEWRSTPRWRFHYDRASNGLRLAWHNMKKTLRAPKLYKRPPSRAD